MRESETGFHPHCARGNHLGEHLAEFATRSQLVAGTAAERLLGLVAAQEPQDLRLRLGVLELDQFEDGTDGRMAGPKHGHDLAGVPQALGPKHVRHAIGDAAGVLDLTENSIPLMPAGLGVLHVPEASITASARRVMAPPPLR